MLQTRRCPVVLPRSADWRAEQILVFEATNEGDSMANLHLMFASADREVRVRIGLFPGFPTKLAIPLAVAGGATLFLDRTPGRFKAVLRRYRKAIERQLDYGVVPPLKLSEYLKLNLPESG